MYLMFLTYCFCNLLYKYYVLHNFVSILQCKEKSLKCHFSDCQSMNLSDEKIMYIKTAQIKQYKCRLGIGLLGSDPFYTVTHVFEVWHDNKIEMISKSKALLVSYTLLFKICPRN